MILGGLVSLSKVWTASSLSSLVKEVSDSLRISSRRSCCEASGLALSYRISGTSSSSSSSARTFSRSNSECDIVLLKLN